MTKTKIIKIIIDLLVLATCILIAYFLSNWMFYKIKISGPSMESNIHNGDQVILYKQGKYKRGDIVVFKTGLTGDDNEGGKYYVKRIIALAGDTVEIKEDEYGEVRIYVNDEVIEENYLDENMPSARISDLMEKKTIPDGLFFFCGDNRRNSNDSRAGLLGDTDAIIGRVIVRYGGNGKNLELVKRPYAVEIPSEMTASMGVL